MRLFAPPAMARVSENQTANATGSQNLFPEMYGMFRQRPNKKTRRTVSQIRCADRLGMSTRLASSEQSVGLPPCLMQARYSHGST
jgi:hypothetical protein